MTKQTAQKQPKAKILALTQAKPIFLVIILCALSYALRMPLTIALLLVILALYLTQAKKNTISYRNIFLYLSLLFVIILALSYIIVINGINSYYIPFVIVPILAQMLFCDLGFSLFTTLAASIAVSAVCGNNYNLFLLFTSSGLGSILLVKEAPRRSNVIRAGIIVGLLQAITLLAIQGRLGNWENYLILFLNGIACSFITLGTLPIFEYLFNTVTDISLLELADFNQPLLQQLIKEAPGTFHHSLVVGNLSDAAAKEVGAHALLARVGAYYHDVGKLTKPDYFSENQASHENIHDELSPTMSKLVIMNHVKEGLDLAKKYKLSQRIMDFIQQHHGNSLVYYFYLRALQGMEGKDDVKEEGFRYPGPKPSTKETAIVLLADSAEAATRTLKDPTSSNIEDLVHKVINNKFIDGQLDSCDLTLKDLEKISAVFIHILGGIYHSRVIYPEMPKNGNNHKKPAIQNPHQSEADKESGA